MSQPETINPDLAASAAILRHGGILLAPSETCFIFAADATNPIPIQRIFQIKKRPGIPSGILVRDIEMAARYAVIEPWQIEFIRHFWPGPLSCVFPRRNNLPDILTAQNSGVAMRQSPYPFWISMFDLIDFPITATSANQHGKPELYDLNLLSTQFSRNQLADVTIIDSLPLPAQAPSTVLDMQCFPPRIIRSGPVTADTINPAILRFSPTPMEF
ncbi:MAG: L-threonylcarbamoyladenylate synthase [Candidatus Delongbacteria bacterium]|nr:L-threonylcarbamoyladenylate synthase [Candidatus Delongbacteria bacterium]